MKVRVVLPILLAYAVAAAAGAVAASVPTADQRFVERAYAGGYADVVLGKLAMQQGSSDASKMLGEKMVNDDTPNVNELAKIAQTQGVSVTPALPIDAQQEQAKLQRLSGNAFDREYISYEAGDRIRDIADYKREFGSTSNAQLRNYAAQALPAIEAQESLARQDAARVGAPLGSP